MRWELILKKGADERTRVAPNNCLSSGRNYNDEFGAKRSIICIVKGSIYYISNYSKTCHNIQLQILTYTSIHTSRELSFTKHTSVL